MIEHILNLANVPKAEIGCKKTKGLFEIVLKCPEGNIILVLPEDFAKGIANLIQKQTNLIEVPKLELAN